MKNTLSSLNIMLTEQCNFACKYCYEKHTDVSMEEETLRKTIELLYQSEDEKIEYWLFGGETLLVPDKVLLAAKYIKEVHEKNNKSKHVVVILFTNGYIYDEKMYKELRKILTGILTYVQVSFDGFGKMHDARVTKGGQRTTEIVAENAIKINKIIPVIIRSTIASDTVDESFDLLSTIRWCTENHITQYAFHLVQECSWSDKNVEIIAAELDRVVGWAKEFYKSNCFGKFSFYQIYDILRPREDRLCRVGSKFFNIDTKGNIYPCHVLYSHYKKLGEENKEGNVLGTVFTDMDASKSDIYKKIIEHYEECSKCDCKVCTPCPAVSRVLYNDLMKKPNDSYCKLMKMVDKKLKELCEHLVKECGFITSDSDWQFLIKLWLHIIQRVSKLKDKKETYQWALSSYRYFNSNLCITNIVFAVKSHIHSSLKQMAELFGAPEVVGNISLVDTYNTFINCLNKEFGSIIGELKTDNLEDLVNVTVDIYDSLAGVKSEVNRS